VKRLLSAIVAIVVLAVVGAGAGSVYIVRRSFPPASGLVSVRGLSDPVEVVRDRWGIPHVYAKHARDLFFAQGYVHAQDRLWQMELSRRTASGRLSELFGEATLQTDRFLRTIGLRRIAEATIHGLTAESRESLEAYAEGVNAFIKGPSGRLPIEFVLLRFRPDPWTPIDTLAYGKLMGWILGGDWRSEILRQQLFARFGEDVFRRLMPDYPADAPIIVPRLAGVGRANPDAPQPWPGLGLAPPPGVGSNSWVVAGSRTETGSPLLANDPHLEGSMPSVWHIMHLSGGGYDVAGATFPGVPGVIIGHNRDIAWGVTNANPDVQDLFSIRFHPDDPTRYLDRGEWISARMIREEIRVKGRRTPVVEQVRWTRHGPVINTVVRGLEATLALRWTGQDSSTILDALDGINRAATWAEFRHALRLWDTPSLNFVFAHRSGEIGYQMPGRVPVRGDGSGGVPSPGWDRRFDWKHAIAFDQLPHRHARDGSIVTANNRIAPASYPFFLGRDWDTGFRARRIEEMLGGGKATIDGFKRIQSDVTSLPARAVVEALKSIQFNDSAVQPFVSELVQWDGVLDPRSRPAAVYEAFVGALLAELFKGPLDDAAFARYMRHRDAPMQSLLALLQQPDSGWWRGSRDEMVTTALREAVRDLTRRLGPSHDQWRWGRLHQPVFMHALGRVKGLAPIFNVMPPEVGGDGFTVNNGGFDPEEPYRQKITASYRQILDPSNWDRSLVIHTTGQSGLPFHKHYRDFAPRWARGEYVPLLFSRQAVDGAAADRLIMTP
jgi:penicillin amidase